MSGIKVDIKNEQKIIKPDIEKINHIAQKVLKEEGINQTEVSILLTDDNKIRELNRKYRKKDTATDVLAFPQTDNKKQAQETKILGDVIISTETCQRQAKLYNQSLLKEFYLYLIHGLLHLLQYKDENLENTGIMRKKQNSYLKEIWDEKD
jgi:probable rRNA maturation factor